MRKITLASSLVLLAAVVVALPSAVGAGAGAVNPGGIVVDDDSICPGTDFTSIQAAVTASPAGSRIQVCPGTYHEQVTIAKPLTLVGVTFANQAAPIVQPAAAVANSTSLTSGNPIAAIILVRATKNVTIQGLTVDGSTGGITGCAPTYAGIYYRNASGTVQNDAVRNVELSSSLFGCQSGLGIFVQSGTEAGVTPGSTVKIADNTVHDYQKNGITANESGTAVTVTGNTVTGVGLTPQIAQNGIQLAFGAKGTVSGNSVINHVYGGCTSPTSCSDVATNILLFDAGAPDVNNNDIGNSQVNVDQEGNNGNVHDNTIYEADVFDGIDLIGNGNTAKNNTINDSDGDGVYVLGNQNHVEGNTIDEASIGIQEDAPSSGNTYTGNNLWNVVTMFQPATIGPHAATAAATREVSAARP
jgi:hypothetical protein